MLGFGVAGLEVEHEVVEPKHAAGAKDRGDALERDRFPEVGKVMQRVPREHEVGWFRAVVVREEPGFDDGDIVETVPFDARPEGCGHGRRNVDRDHPATERRDGRGERTGSRPEVDDDGAGVETVPTQNVDVVRRVEAGLPLVPGDVTRIEMLVARVPSFVEPPIRHCGQSDRSR